MIGAIRASDITVSKLRDRVGEDTDEEELLYAHREGNDDSSWDKEVEWDRRWAGNTEANLQEQLRELNGNKLVRVGFVDLNKKREIEQRNQEVEAREARLAKQFSKDFGYIKSVSNSLTKNRYHIEVDEDNKIVRTSWASGSGRFGQAGYSEISSERLSEFRKDYQST